MAGVAASATPPESPFHKGICGSERERCRRVSPAGSPRVSLGFSFFLTPKSGGQGVDMDSAGGHSPPLYIGDGSRMVDDVADRAHPREARSRVVAGVATLRYK